MFEAIPANWVFWAAGAAVVMRLHRAPDRGSWRPRTSPFRGAHLRSSAETRAVPRADGRLAGLVCGAACAHLGWVAMHAVEIHARHGVGGWLAWALDPTGFSVLFAPLGPVLVRCLRQDEAGELDADLRAWMAGIAVARLGCVFTGCCGGGDLRPLLQALHGVCSGGGPGGEGDPGAGLPGLQHPVALYEGLLMACVAVASRRVGRGGVAIAAFAVVRLALAPLRPAALKGAANWAPWVAVAWIAFGLWSLPRRAFARMQGRA